MIICIKTRNLIRVVLWACDNDYGQTFVDWFAFQAAEMGLNPVGIATYKDKTEISDYSGGVAKECEGIPGLLVMTAANANESSKADLWYAPYGVYITNRFTSSIISRLKSDPATSLRDLYNVAFTGTLGSHVKE